MKSGSSKYKFAMACGLWWLSAWAAANPADHAGQAIKSGLRASGNAITSVGHSLAATGQLASGVIATPILASGVVAAGVGSAATHVGSALMGAATQPIGTPLPVSDETISVMAPNKALQTPQSPNN